MYKQSVRIKAHVTSIQTHMIYHKENKIWWWVGWRYRAEILQLGGGMTVTLSGQHCQLAVSDTGGLLMEGSGCMVRGFPPSFHHW